MLFRPFFVVFIIAASGCISSLSSETVSTDSKSEVILVNGGLRQSDAHKHRRSALGVESVQDADPRLNPDGLSIYAQHVWGSGIGLQANLGVYSAEVEEDYGVITVNIRYTFPVVLNYHFYRGSLISPFAGIGVSRSVYASGKWVEKEAGVWKKERKVKNGFSPLMDLGIAFGGDSPIQLILNMKYFTSLYKSKANMLTAGAGVSINW